MSDLYLSVVFATVIAQSANLRSPGLVDIHVTTTYSVPYAAQTESERIISLVTGVLESHPVSWLQP